jgi:hypothetical protein
MITKIYECRNCYSMKIQFTRGRPNCRFCRERAYLLKMQIVGWIQWNPRVRIPWDLQWNVVDVVVEKRELQNNVSRVLQFILIPCSNVRKDVVSNSHGHPWSVWVIYVEILKGFNLLYRGLVGVFHRLGPQEATAVALSRRPPPDGWIA